MGNKASNKLSVALEDVIPTDKSAMDPAMRQYTPELSDNPHRLSPNHIRVVSFNLPCNAVDSKTGSKEWRKNLFKNRCPFAGSLLEYYQADVVCFQEPHLRQTQMLQKEAGSEWKCFSRGREKDGSSEAQPIFYRSSKFADIKTGCFWLSETPEEQGSKSWGSACTRHVPYVVLNVKGTGFTFAVFNVHFDHESEEARRKSAELLVSKAKSLDMPCILCGDFNCRKDSPAMQLLQKTFSMCPVNSPTFFGWQRDLPGDEIDFILTSTGVECVSAHVLQDKFKDGRVLSDHAPILVDLKLVAVKTPPTPDLIAKEEGETVGAGAGAKEISTLLIACVEFIRKNGLDSEGLFRIPGSKEIVDRIANDPQHANASDVSSLEELKGLSINDVCTLLKQLLRSRSPSVVSNELYDAYCSSVGEGNSLRGVEPMLSSPRHECLRFMLKFLHEISLHQEANKMSSKNLATVFAPSLYSADLTATPQDYLVKLPTMIDLLQQLIDLGGQLKDTSASIDEPS